MEKRGLSDVYEHYIDADGNKFFTANTLSYGVVIRQFQTIDGNMQDISDSEFFQKMVKMGFEENQGFFGIYNNRYHFSFVVHGSETGIPNAARLLM